MLPFVPAMARSSLCILISIACSLAGLTIFAGLACGAGDLERTLPLCGFNSTDGLSITWGSSCTEKKLQLNTDRRFVSEGAASVHLSGRSGKQADTRHYLGLRIPLNKVDVTARSIVLDCWTSTPEATEAIYVRLTGPQSKRAAGWNKWGRPFQASPHLTVRLDLGYDRGGFHWESSDIQTDKTAAIETAEILIGTAQADTVFDIYVDDLRMTEARHVKFDEVRTAKKIYRETPLVQSGRAKAIIVAPSDPPYTALATKIQAKLRALGGTDAPILKVEEATPAQLSAHSAILLGNVVNNRALIPLYATLYTPVDEGYPAADGYLVHTVHDPWGTGHNAVVVGASSPAGAEKAVAAFLASLPAGPDVVLPKLNLFELDAREMKEVARLQRTLNEAEIRRQVELARQDFTRGGHRTVAGHMAHWGAQYGRTGNEMLARLYKEVAVAWYESYQARPPIYGGPWGMDMDFHLMEILPAWDLVEASPALTDADRLQVTRILFEFITTDVVRKASGALTSKLVRHNHMTFPALGLFFAGRYFQQSYHCIEADQWLEITRACFTLQSRAAKPWENCNGYGWLVPYHTLRYSLATGDPTYFENGNVRLQADYAILTMDNLGYQVPYGDTGSYQCWWSEIPYLRGATFYHRDGRWAWALEKKLAVHPDTSLQQYVCRVKAQEPTDLLGTRAIALDKMYWESVNGPQTIPLEKAVDKVVMRASFDPQRQYLLLDGLSNGGHMHFDGNSIPRITDRGRIWLADNDYIRSLPKFHNSLLVFREGHADQLPPFCELETVADGRQLGLSLTTVHNYTGVDWRRAILWCKDRFFLVLDEIAAREPADYDFHCLWHLMGQPQLTADGLMVEQQGPRMFIKSLPGARLKLSDDVELGRSNWNGYAYAEPIVRRLREAQSARLAPGGRCGFVNLLYTSDPEHPQKFTIAAIGETEVAAGDKRAGQGGWTRAAVVRAEDRAMLAGLGDPDRPREIVPGLKIAARAFLISEKSVLAADATLIACRGVTIRSAQPVTIELAEGRLELKAMQAAKVELTGCPAGGQVSGQGKLDATDGSHMVVTLAAGATTVRWAEGLTLAGLNELLVAGPTSPAAATAAPPPPRLPQGRLLWTFRPEPTAPTAPSTTAVSKTSNRTRQKTAPTPTKSAGPDKIISLAAGDLHGDGRDSIIAGTEQNRVYGLDAAGKPQWQFATAGRVTTAAAARLDGGMKKTALIGSEDCKVYALEADGRVRWSFEMPTYKAPGRVRVLFPADINADGSDEVVVGGDNWRYYVLDPRGHELWHYESVHPSTAGAVVDFDGNGRLSLLCGTAYYWWHCAGPDGQKRWSYSVPTPHATVALSARFEKSGPRTALFGGEDGTLHALDAKGKLLWKANVGDEVSAAVAFDLNGDGRETIVVGSKSDNLFALDARGQTVWRTNLDDAVAAVIKADVNGDSRDEVVVGLDDGRIIVLDGHGQPQAEYRVASGITGLTAARLSHAGSARGQAIVATTVAGPIVAVAFLPASNFRRP